MELLEREHFVNELEGLLGAVAAGNGRLALIGGEAGIGKTSLVERFTDAHKAKARVLWGACDALLTPRPLGPLYAGQRAGEGYHGYHFKIIKAQGNDAPGGAYDYVVGGRYMIGGFALVAFPAEYEKSGVMTFLVNHDGVVYQKDLGPKTMQLAEAMKRFDPDSSWQRVEGSALKP